MDINENLFVEIVPMTGPHAPQPSPVGEANFDPGLIYKVLGMYNPSETSECYFILSNPQRQLWFISQRHVRAVGIIRTDELTLPKPGNSNGHGHGVKNGNGHANGSGHANGNGHAVLQRLK